MSVVEHPNLQLVPEEEISFTKKKVMENLRRSGFIFNEVICPFPPDCTYVFRKGKLAERKELLGKEENEMIDEISMITTGVNEITTNYLTSIGLGEPLHDTSESYSGTYPSSLQFIQDIASRMVTHSKFNEISQEEALKKVIVALGAEYLRPIDQSPKGGQLQLILKAIYPKLRRPNLAQNHTNLPEYMLEEAIQLFVSTQYIPEREIDSLVNVGNFDPLSGEIQVKSCETPSFLPAGLQAASLGLGIGMSQAMLFFPEHSTLSNSIGAIGTIILALQLFPTIDQITKIKITNNGIKERKVTLVHEIIHQLSTSEYRQGSFWRGKNGFRRYMLKSDMENE